MTVAIRAERTTDHEAIARVVGEAFGSVSEIRLVDRIRASPEYRPELSLVAEHEGEIVGHVMISGATLRSTDGDHPIVMLSPLAVDPAHQRAGIGGRLVREVTHLAGLAGHPFVVLEGSPQYYSRLGFEPAATYGITLPLPDWAPPEAAQILRLDAFTSESVHGGGTVIYPPAFDAVE